MSYAAILYFYLICPLLYLTSFTREHARSVLSTRLLPMTVKTPSPLTTIMEPAELVNLPVSIVRGRSPTVVEWEQLRQFVTDSYKRYTARMILQKLDSRGFTVT